MVLFITLTSSPVSASPPDDSDNDIVSWLNSVQSTLSLLSLFSTKAERILKDKDVITSCLQTCLQNLVDVGVDVEGETKAAAGTKQGQRVPADSAQDTNPKPAKAPITTTFSSKQVKGKVNEQIIEFHLALLLVDSLKSSAVKKEDKEIAMILRDYKALINEIMSALSSSEEKELFCSHIDDSVKSVAFAADEYPEYVATLLGKYTSPLLELSKLVKS